MKREHLRIGATYCNKGAGRTRRRIINIGPECRPGRWYGSGDPPDEDGVLFVQLCKHDGQWEPIFKDLLYISAFAAWAGREVENSP